MKLTLITFVIIILCSCSKNTTIKSSATEAKNLIAKNDKVQCKVIKKTGTRLNSKRCTTKKQRELEANRVKDELNNNTYFNRSNNIGTPPDK